MSMFDKIAKKVVGGAVSKVAESAKEKIEKAAETVVDKAVDKATEAVIDKMGVASSGEEPSTPSPSQTSDDNKESKVSNVVDATTKIADNVTKIADTASKVANVAGTATSVGGAVMGGVATPIFAQLPVIIGVILLVGSLTTFLVVNPFGWDYNNIFGGAPKIEKTANVVEKVRKISEFTTACYYEEYVIKNEKLGEEKSFFSSKVDTVNYEVVITVKGSVRAGFDLSALGEQDLIVRGDTIDIKLPAPQVFDVISNPSDYKIFVETGKWEHDEIVAMQSKGREHTLNNALNSNLLQRANKVGKERITALFNNFGFSVVNVTLTEPAAAPEEVAEETTSPEETIAAETEAVATDSIATATAPEDVVAADSATVEAPTVE